MRVHDAGPGPLPSFAIADPEADPALKRQGGLRTGGRRELGQSFLCAGFDSNLKQKYKI